MRFLAAALPLLFLYSAQSSPHKGYLVKLRKPFSSSQRNLFKDLNIKVESKIPELRLVQTDVSPFDIDLTAADRILLNTLIEYVEPNHYVKTFEDIMGESSNNRAPLFNMALINAPDAWEVTTGSRDVIVAISDTGVWEHPDLVDNLWYNTAERGKDKNGKNKSKNKIDEDSNGFIDDYMGWDFNGKSNLAADSMYHGTHVAGIVGAVGDNKLGLAGVAWQTRLLSAKFLDRSGSGYDADGIRSLIYAADNGARVVNCSWGGNDGSKALYDAIEYLKNKNVLVVAAAGNSNEDTDKYPQYPSALDNENIISVASIDDKKGRLSWFSNWGAKTVDIAAPGNNIYSTWNPTYQSASGFYNTISGTSMAAPHVTGAIALIYSVNPNLKWNEVKDIILFTAYKAPKLKGKVLTEAILDVGAAVRAAQALKK